ncbi:MAG: orotidine-5'-phosphate decarboxylase [Candidatus Aminicenantes bacterium]|nr:orotidine-5'-phosphate decarboxylase [Candidatus Aminicenantes bacterium]
MNDAENRLIVALDYPSWPDAEKMVGLLPEVKFFKVGLELYLASRGEAVRRLREAGKEVFLDLKFHDIPHTVAQASRQAALQGASIINVHAAGGREMMTKAAQAVKEQAEKARIQKPLLVAITVLTSLNEEDLEEIGLGRTEKTVPAWARLALEAGLDGVVASPQEIQLIRKSCGPDFKIICPGVRPAWSDTGDQKRVLTPGEAMELGADFIVVGRPITRAEKPREAALRIMDEMKKGLARRYSP